MPAQYTTLCIKKDEKLCVTVKRSASEDNSAEEYYVSITARRPSNFEDDFYCAITLESVELFDAFVNSLNYERIRILRKLREAKTEKMETEKMDAEEEARERRADKIIGDEHLISDYRREKGRI
jgi:hypothetical protein